MRNVTRMTTLGIFVTTLVAPLRAIQYVDAAAAVAAEKAFQERIQMIEETIRRGITDDDSLKKAIQLTKLTSYLPLSNSLDEALESMN